MSAPTPQTPFLVIPKHFGHTPGPLKAERAKFPDNTGGYDYAITDQNNQIIAECFEHTGRAAAGGVTQYIVQPAAANARLFVAASDMLAVLRDARSAIASLPEDALGFGGSGPQPNTPDDPGDSDSWPITAELLHNIDAAIAKATGAA